MKVMWVAVAGAAGAVSRYLLGGVIAERARGAFPWGTFAVNVAGSLVLGFLFVVLTERVVPHPAVRLALTVGFLGSFTTFSTLMLETANLAEGGAAILAVVNIAASVAAGIVAVYLGIWVGRAL